MGDDDAPPRQSSDEANCAWCKAREAVLVTNDRGKKDRKIISALDRHQVGAVFIHNDLRGGEPHELACALLIAEVALDDLTKRRKRLRHRLRPTGKLEPR